MTSVDSNFLCGRPHGTKPLPIHTHPLEPELRTDVRNGWPLTFQNHRIHHQLNFNSVLKPTTSDHNILSNVLNGFLDI